MLNLLEEVALWLQEISKTAYAIKIVSTVENRQGLKIVVSNSSFQKQMDIKKEIKNSINFYGNCPYSSYLKSIIENK